MTAGSPWPDEHKKWLAAFLKEKRQGVTLLHKRVGKAVFLKGTPMSQITLIMKGRVRIDAVSPQGRVVYLETCSERRWLGTTAHELGHHLLHTHNAHATMDTDLVAFTVADFPKLLDEHPMLNALFTMGVTDNNNSLFNTLEGALFNSTAMRLAWALHSMFDGKDSETILIDEKMGPSQFGRLINVSRETARKVRDRFLEFGILTEWQPDTDRYYVHRGPLEAFLASGDQDDEVETSAGNRQHRRSCKRS